MKDEKLEILEDLYNSSRFEEGLRKCFELEKHCVNSWDIKFQIRIFKLKFLEKLERYDEGITFAHLLLKTSQLIKSTISQVEVLIELTKIYFSVKRMDDVIKTIQSAEEILYSTTNLTDEDIKPKMAELILLRGGYEWNNGELENALFFFKFNLDLQKSLNQPLDMAHALNNIGVIYNAMGDLQKALEFLEKAYAKYKKIHYTRGISKTGHNIGAILIQRGELDESLTYIENSLRIDEEDNYKEGIRVAFQNMGEIYWHKREYSKAIVNLTAGYKLLEGTESPFEITEICIPLMAVYLEINEIFKAFSYLIQIIEIQKENPNKIIQQRLWLAKGLYFKALNTPLSIEKARFYFEKIIEDEVRYYDITAMTLIQIACLTLIKYEQHHTEEILQDLNSNIEKLIHLAEKNQSYSMLVESMILKAKSLELQNSGIFAHKILQEALNLAQKHGIKHLEERILITMDNYLEKSSHQSLLTPGDQALLDKLLLEELKNHIHTMFAPKIPEKYYSLEEKIIPECFLLVDSNKKTIMNLDFTSKWQEGSLSYSIFQIQFIKLLKDYIFNGLSIHQYENSKLDFFQVHNYIGCFIYQGSVRIGYEKVSFLQNYLSEHILEMMELRQDETNQEYLVKFVEEDLHSFIATLCL